MTVSPNVNVSDWNVRPARTGKQTTNCHAFERSKQIDASHLNTNDNKNYNITKSTVNSLFSSHFFSIIHRRKKKSKFQLNNTEMRMICSGLLLNWNILQNNKTKTLWCEQATIKPTDTEQRDRRSTHALRFPLHSSTALHTDRQNSSQKCHCTKCVSLFFFFYRLSVSKQKHL